MIFSGFYELREGKCDSPLMLINGEWVGSNNGKSFPVENPANGNVIAQVPQADFKDVDVAVCSAANVFGQWKKTPSRERGDLLAKIADAIVENTESIAQTLAAETGNAIRTQSRPEVGLAVNIFRYFSGLGVELKGETVPINDSMLNYTLREPLGVVGAIIPWNAPLGLAALKIAPALLTGNTVVLKTAETAPLSVMLLARICNDFLPAGVLNVLTGYGEECGAPLMAHPLINKITFTGSTNTGKRIMTAAAERVVPVSLELGGKSPNIIFPDVNEDWVVNGAISAARIHRQTQSCSAGTRLFIHEKIFDSFLESLVEKLSHLKMGDPLDESSDVGCISNKDQFDKVCSYIDEGIKNPDAKLISGGLPDADCTSAGGYYVKPTIFTGLGNDWHLAREEIFGPVLCAIPWSEESDVIRMANDTHYGLAAFIWTRDIGKALRTAHAIESGFVQVNQGVGQFPGQSYGGMKQSGIGSEYSLEGMLESYTVRKNINVNINTP